MANLSYAAPGFGPLTISDVTVNGTIIPSDFQNAISNVTVTRAINLASTLIIQLTDPKRKILNSPNFLQQGATVEIPDGFGNYLQFTLTSVHKAGDQIQLTFESIQIYKLRSTRGVLSGSDVTDAGAFVQALCAQAGIQFVGPIGNPAIQPTTYAMSGGSTYNPQEDAWTSINRIAGSLGWRCWESAGVVFFGPDNFWFNQLYQISRPPVNAWFNHDVPTLREFSQPVQLMDFDWNIGSPFGDVTITAMSNFWQYNPGEIVYLDGLGPATGPWMISAMQRNFFNPQATITCTVPMPSALVIDPPVLPIVSGRPSF